jgi:uncharacterized protein YdaU (DUF1376 family)
MAALPYMQLYVADYLADTAHLTTEEHGAYMLLLFSYWQTGKPLRQDRLASVARLSSERWTSVERTLKEFFHVAQDTWTHFRVEADLEKVGSKSKKNSDAGKASAKARALAKQALAESESTNVGTNVGTSAQQTYQRNVNHARSGDTDTDTDIDTEHQKLLAKKLASDAEKKRLEESFDSFWKLYPKKASKKDAIKAWSKIEPDKHPEIMQGLANHRTCDQWVKDEGQFIPNAATWLNAERWEDEVKPARPVGVSKHSGFSGQRDYEAGLHDNGDGTYGF